jgi:hypothetical protein
MGWLHADACELLMVYNQLPAELLRAPKQPAGPYCFTQSFLYFPSSLEQEKTPREGPVLDDFLHFTL